MNSKNKFVLKMKIRDSFFDSNDKISFQSLMALFQDVSGMHSQKMKIGYLDLLAKNLYWVLVRMKIDVLKQPTPHQDVSIETYALPKSRFEFDRDFYIVDKKGELLVKATSKWVVISTITRKIESTNQIPYPNIEPDKRAYNDKFIKSPTLDYTLLTPNYSHKVSFNEIDHNQHLNNTYYANYIYNALQGKALSHLQINFNSECILGNIIDIYTKVNEENNEILIAGDVNNELKFTALAY